VAAVAGVRAREPGSPDQDARLLEASEDGCAIEVILVLRGKVRPHGAGRWRMRTDGGHVVTFPAANVVAATPSGRS
jgi:hypothetical protein